MHKLAPVPTGSHAHDQAAVRQLIHTGQLLGEYYGIAHRKDKDASAELDLRGARGDGGEQDEESPEDERVAKPAELAGPKKTSLHDEVVPRCPTHGNGVAVLTLDEAFEPVPGREILSD